MIHKFLNDQIMRFNPKIRFMSAIVIFALLFTACHKKDDISPESPSITVPSTTQLLIGESTELTFNVSTPEGYKSSIASVSSNGTAEITSQPDKGATSGEVVVNFTAEKLGAATITLIVTDQAGSEEDGTVAISIQEEKTKFIISEDITANTTWEDGKIYILDGRISVKDGYTLTIEPGTIIKGQAGEGANASVLIIARGATIIATGTALQPIIFTSVADEITPEMIDNGKFASPNLTSENRGLWGGVIILGYAPISVPNGAPAQIEGIPSSDKTGLYGGDKPTDNSGSFTYVSIRHGGTNIGQGNEINGLSLGGVGSGTTIHHIEIVANQDDGVEFFGGTINASHILVWDNGDDAIDTDQAWSGTITNTVIISPGEDAFELDGPEGSFKGKGGLIEKCTYFASDATGIIDVDGDTDCNVKNILIFGLPTNDGTAAATMTDDYSDYADNTHGYSISNIEAVIPSGFQISDFFIAGSASLVTPVSSVSAATVGADISQFDFTWVKSSGTLNNLGF